MNFWQKYDTSTPPTPILQDRAKSAAQYQPLPTGRQAEQTPAFRPPKVEGLIFPPSLLPFGGYAFSFGFWGRKELGLPGSVMVEKDYRLVLIGNIQVGLIGFLLNLKAKFDRSKSNL